MTRRDRSERRALAGYRIVLRAYPASFREAYGRDMEETFQDLYRAARSHGAAAAARCACAAFLDATSNGLRERLHSTSLEPHMLYWHDIRYALRLLRRSPLFTLLTIIVLSGGLGVSIFTYSFLHSVMLRPLPVSEGEQIVRVMQEVRGSAPSLDAADLALMRPHLTTLADVGAYTDRELILGSDGARRVLDATAAEWNIFEVTRTRPALGRGFRADDQARGAEPVIVLGYRVWQAVFGGDSSVIDRTVMLNGITTRVIGVMPPGFGFPVAADAWVPLGDDIVHAVTPGVHDVDVFARRAATVSNAAAERELTILFANARATHAPARAGAGREVPPRIVVQSYPMAQIGEEAPLVLAVLNLLAVLILLLACINVLNLLLARANERARETAVRLALGASRPRLVMQSLWESVVLVVSGGVLATAIAAAGLSSINRWAQQNLEGNLAFWWVWGLDGATLAAAGAFVTLTLAVLGGVVSARAVSTRFNAVLQDAGARSGSGGGRRIGRLSRVLVATQVAVVSVLMFFGVMSAVVAYRVATVDVGYETDRLLSTSVELPPDRYASGESRRVFFRRLSDALSDSPELDGVLFRTNLAAIDGPASEIELSGFRAATGARPRAYVQGVLGSLATLGVALRDGRFLDASDRAAGAPTVVVSQAFATRHWPGRSAVGQQLRLTGLAEPDRDRTVVGVVSDVLMGHPLSRDRSAQAVYVPLAQVDARSANAVFRYRANAAAAHAVWHQSLGAIDPLMAPSSIATFEEVLAKTALLARSVTVLFAGCFGFALLLAVSGTYGLMARSIGQRTREIGVRRALGATDGLLLRLLLGQGTRQLGIGALAAVPAMLLVGIGFAKFVPVGVGFTLFTGTLTIVSIVGVVLAATYVPTRRALAILPRDALARE
jgi:predicted permease